MLVWEVFCAVFKETSRKRKGLWIREGNQHFPSKIFVSKCQKISPDKPSVLCFRKTPVATMCFDKRVRGGARFSVEKNLYHSARNNRRGTF